MRRALLVALLVLNALLLPCGCCVLANGFNPMLLAFITQIRVTNRTAQPIRVTPIGTIDPDGRRSPLPIAASRMPAYPALRRGAFSIGPGETLELLFDWDDINLSELVVQDASGKLAQLVVDAEPTREQFHPPRSDPFVISDLTALAPVPNRVRDAFEEAQGIHHRVWMLFALPWLSFAALVWVAWPTFRRQRTAGVPRR